METALDILRNVGAVLTDDHFVYSSKRHGTAYVNKDAVYPHTTKVSMLCGIIARRFGGDDIEVVVGPAVGGIPLTQWTANHLAQIMGGEVFAVFAEKDTDSTGKEVFVIKRGYDRLVSARRVLVVEDVLTTGGSAEKTVESVRAANGIVVGLAALCNRGGVTPQMVGNVPKMFALASVTLETWSEAECPLCAQGIPVNVSVGHGKEFMRRKQEAA